MTNFYDIKATGSEQPEDNYRPSLPARFQINGWLRLDEKLWVYDVFDQIVDQPARLWLEEINLQPEAYQSRAISLQKLSHGNLLPIYNHFMWGENGKKYYVCVAKTPGKDYVNCRMLIASSPGINVVGQIARQLALALLYCHSQQVLHGNLQPSFIWIGRDGTVRLELFGALPNRRHALGNEAQGNFSNSLLNAPYASPELFGSSASFNTQADVYALGVIIYELLTGFNPFLAGSEMVSGLRHMYKAVPPLHQVNPEVGPALEAAIMTALYKNPEGRYHNVLELLSQFEIGLATTLQTAHQPVPFQTIDQLLENYTALNNEVQTFLKQTAPSLAASNIFEEEKYPSQAGVVISQNGNGNGTAAYSWPLQSGLAEIGPVAAPGKANGTAPKTNGLDPKTDGTLPPANGIAATTNGTTIKPVVPLITPDPIAPPEAAGPALQSAPAVSPVNQSVQATRPAEQDNPPTGSVRPGVPATKTPLEKPAPVSKRPPAKWPSLIPWLLVLNLFFMGYLAWLLLNSVDTSGSGLPTSYPTIPPRAVFTPVLGATPTATPEPTITSTAIPTLAPVIITTVPPLATSTVTTALPPTPEPTEAITVPPTPAPATPAPASSGPTVTDPRVLTALAPTATSSFGSSEPVATVQLAGDDTPAATPTPANPG